MPHINIKHFPVSLNEARKKELISRLTETVASSFKCSEDVISIALEPIEKELWNKEVYFPEIVNRKEFLCKTPNYSA